MTTPSESNLGHCTGICRLPNRPEPVTLRAVARLTRACIRCALFLAATSLFAQYGQIIDEVAGQEALTVGASLRLLGVAAGSIAPELGPADVRPALSRLGIRVPRDPDDSRISYGEFAFLLMQLYDRPGGLASRIMPGPRAAFRDLQASGFIPPTARAGYPISGPDALLLQRRFLEGRKGSP